MYDKLHALLARWGQEHLLAFWNDLDRRRQASLAAEIRGIDFELIERLYRQRDAAGEVRELADRARRPPVFRIDGSTDGSRNRFTPEQAKHRAAEALGAGRVGVILVAGGEGSRLGFDRPKGMFPIGPVSGHSLFQIHIEKIVAAGRRWGARIPLLVMTSPATHEATVAFLDGHDRFGLAEEDLRVFCQGTMPAVDAASGKVLLESPSHVALSPDGHGGTLAALARSGSLAEAKRRGIEHLFYLQVDNPLVDICGPEFLGYHLLCRSEFSSQVIAKRDPMEKVGNVVERDGRLHVIEYSDLPEPVARRTAADGSLEIWAGSIAVHVMDVAMLERMAEAADALPPHIARKKVPHIDLIMTHSRGRPCYIAGRPCHIAGRPVVPEEPNAIKFERFIFDLMPRAAGAILVEVDRSRHFAPLKNASGEPCDTPETVRAQMVAEHTRWLRQAGVEVADGVAVEISPLFGLDAEEVGEKVGPGTRVTEPTFYC
jgi:UDP-N-acetylglucosamine/UDP-N-acetylgalactosamine diphosphorylase